MAKPMSPFNQVVQVPVYLIGVAVFFAVLLAGLFLWCASEDPNRMAPIKIEDLTNAPPTGQGSGPASDAFKVKEDRKKQLLEKARARYLELNPGFVPPPKPKSL